MKKIYYYFFVFLLGSGTSLTFQPYNLFFLNFIIFPSFLQILFLSKKNNFNINNFYSILDGYKINSVFSEDEKNHFNTLLRGAAMRILITRLHDQIFHPDGAMVVPKDPIEYFKILKWHQNNSVFN